MNRQELFDVKDLPRIHELIRDNALGTLILQHEGALYVDHLPFVLETAPACTLGRLRTHAARDNPFWATLPQSVQCTVVFSGPNSYISPSWYPSRRLHGRVQPSWYYCVVHTLGTLRLHRDAPTLAANVRTMTDYFEAHSGEDAWRVDEAPAEFVDSLIEHIIGIEIELRDLVGKWQVGQQRNHADRQGIVAALMRSETTQEQKLARKMLEASTFRRLRSGG